MNAPAERSRQTGPRAWVEGAELVLHSPYNFEFIETLKFWIPHAHRFWDEELKFWRLTEQTVSIEEIGQLVKYFYGRELQVLDGGPPEVVALYHAQDDVRRCEAKVLEAKAELSEASNKLAGLRRSLQEGKFPFWVDRREVSEDNLTDLVRFMIQGEDVGLWFAGFAAASWKAWNATKAWARSHGVRLLAEGEVRETQRADEPCSVPNVAPWVVELVERMRHRRENESQCDCGYRDPDGDYLVPHVKAFHQIARIRDIPACLTEPREDLPYPRYRRSVRTKKLLVFWVQFPDGKWGRRSGPFRGLKKDASRVEWQVQTSTLRCEFAIETEFERSRKWLTEQWPGYLVFDHEPGPPAMRSPEGVAPVSGSDPKT